MGGSAAYSTDRGPDEITLCNSGFTLVKSSLVVVVVVGGGKEERRKWGLNHGSLSK